MISISASTYSWNRSSVRVQRQKRAATSYGLVCVVNRRNLFAPFKWASHSR